MRDHDDFLHHPTPVFQRWWDESGTGLWKVSGKGGWPFRKKVASNFTVESTNESREDVDKSSHESS